MDGVPAQARAVVIGAGVAGCSVAYHLASLGWSDVVVIEQHAPGDGTSWHSAGFVGQLRSSLSQTRMIMYSTRLYASLGVYSRVGGLRIAAGAEREFELRRARDMALAAGLDLELVGPSESVDLVPLLHPDPIRSAAWIPGDGYLEPEDLIAALITEGRFQVYEGVHVTGINADSGRVRGVSTSVGEIACDVVVNAAGAGAGLIGGMASVAIPVVPMRHQYALTGPLDGVSAATPTVRDPDRIVYFRPKDGGWLVGGYARSPLIEPSENVLQSPRTLYTEDRSRFAESWTGAQALVPALRGMEPPRFICGPEAFTPDGEFILGETPVRGLWVAAGFCVHGIAAAGGVGKAIAEWIVGGQPEWDVSAMDIRRFGRQYASAHYARVRALDGYSRYYDISYPGEVHDAGRPLRVSPAYQRLDALGARFSEKSGWERADWFVANERALPALQPTGWAGRFWSDAIAAECLAVRDAVGLFDQTSFGKLSVRGPGALALLLRVCAGRIDKPVGSVVYTQMLNPRGGIEADITVTRVGVDEFRLVTGTASPRRDREWIRAAAGHPASGDAASADRVEVIDISGTEACYCLWGPRAFDVLGPLCDAPETLAPLGFLKAFWTTVAGVPVLLQRVTFVGEYGFELHCPAEYGLALWDALWPGVEAVGGRAAGYRALDALRLEKGYRVWGTDVTPETNPLQAGLGFAVQLDREGFIGREALLSAGEAGIRLRALVLDQPSSVCLGNEAVRRLHGGGEIIGSVTSAGYGYRLDRSIAYAYLPVTIGIGDTVEISLFAEWVRATVVEDPLYDPTGDRVRHAPR